MEYVKPEPRLGSAVPFSVLTHLWRAPSLNDCNPDGLGVPVEYVKPEIVDYGTLEDLTAGAPTKGSEDGGNKFHATR
jgi:hypothetical protein